MAKAKSGRKDGGDVPLAPTKQNPGPKPLPAEARRSATIQARVYPDFYEWVEGYAVARGMSITKLVEDTLRAVAKAGGYKPEPPPQR